MEGRIQTVRIDANRTRVDIVNDDGSLQSDIDALFPGHDLLSRRSVYSGRFDISAGKTVRSVDWLESG